MSKRLVTSLLLLFLWKIAGISTAFGQTYAGYWLGVTYPSDPSNAIFNYFGNFTQSGNMLGGTAQTANPLVAFGGVAYVKGTVTATTVKFKESDKSGSLDTPLTCYWSLDMKYDPVEESLKGTYTNIQNPSYCDEVGGGKVELYRIVLKSGNKYCKGQAVNLTVTGKNIRWYDSSNKGRMLAQGNNFSPKIDETTTFYITQTLYNSESPAIPVKIEIVNLVIAAISGEPISCGKQNGTLVVTALGASDNKEYSIDGGVSYQSSNKFTGLGEGNYKVKVKDDAGCSADGNANVQPANLSIKGVKTRHPTCGLANGSLTIEGSGANPRYSLDGINFQKNNVFDKLPGGEYTVSVRDTFACPATAKATLIQLNAVKINTATATPTTCGKEDGGITVTTTAANAQFSLDGSKFQPGANFRNLAAGSYTVSMRDTAGCIDTRIAVVKPSNGPKFDGIDLAPVSCGVADGRVAVRATGNNVQYAMNAGSFGTRSSFENLAVGEYEVAVKDANDCVILRKVTVRSDCANTIFVPTSFSPNGDGQNDQLTVHFPFPMLQFPSVRIYNRWGIAVHGSQNLTLSNGDAIWDGRLDGQTSMTENYYVVVAEVMFDDGSTHTFKKEVVVMR
ncbi:gliding motility-associated C-terminal domain-containing protein [Persicitalea sp.]|uniref:T9SS type B sorting domain-containing protein n=1 Tax=Persicitalea sp. TaxID=3100273 RepID=UPI003593C6B4